MELFENINQILSLKNMSKREFAQKLIALEPKSNRTGEILSETIIYSYLNGKTAIKAYLIPYISDVLGIPEQFLFEENPRVRRRMIKYLAESLTKEEEDYLRTFLEQDENREKQQEILELIRYAPEPLLRKIKNTLLQIKNITEQI